VAIAGIRNANGDHAQALAASEQGLDYARKLSAAHPDNTEWQGLLSTVLSSTGMFRAAAGNQAGALELYKESLAIARKIAADEPNETNSQMGVASVLAAIGNSQAALGDRPNAIAAYGECLGILRKALAADPANLDLQVNLATVLQNLADAGDNPQGRWNEALTILNPLKSEDRLSPGQIRWIDTIEARLTKLAQARQP
jgi:tetratricopeptide (TPR) repeat protein